MDRFNMPPQSTKPLPGSEKMIAGKLCALTTDDKWKPYTMQDLIVLLEDARRGKEYMYERACGLGKKLDHIHRLSECT